MPGLQVLSAPPNQPTLNPQVQSAPSQPTLAPQVTAAPQQPVLAPKVVTQPQQPSLAPQVISQPQGQQASLPVSYGKVIDSIVAAKARGADAATILNAIIAQNPDKTDVISTALQRGATPEQILDKIIQDNYTPSTDTPTPSNQPQPLKSTKANLALGATKGLASTGLGIAGLLGKALNPVGDWISQQINPKSGTSVDTPNLKVAPTVGLAQKIGFGAEQLAELFAIPDSGAEKLVTEAPGIAKLAESSPKLFKAIELGAKGLKEGVTNLGLGQVHGSDSPTADFALGAAAPLVGHGLSKAWDSLPQIIGKGTGLSDSIIQEAVDNRPQFLKSLKEVAANPTSPYNSLAHEVSSSMIGAEQTTKAAYKEGLAKVAEATGSKTFDVSPQINEFNKVLKDDYGLPVQLARDESGKLTKQLEIVTDTPNGNPFSKSETDTINNLLNQMRGANNKTFTGLQNLQKSVDNAFDTDVFGKAKSTPFNSVIGKLSDIVDKKVASVAQDAVSTMKPLNAQYAQYKQVMREFGKKFIDRTGDTPTTATTAESYLSNLLNKNKLQQQGNVAKKLEEFTGIPILDRVTSLKAAENLSKLQASGKANAVQKFLKTSGGVIGGGVGLHLGGAGGAVAGAGGGYKIGQYAGKLASPEAGINAIRATKKIGQVATKGLGKLPSAVQDAAGNVASRFLK